MNRWCDGLRLPLEVMVHAAVLGLGQRVTAHLAERSRCRALYSTSSLRVGRAQPARTGIVAPVVSGSHMWGVNEALSKHVILKCVKIKKSSKVKTFVNPNVGALHSDFPSTHMESH